MQYVVAVSNLLHELVVTTYQGRSRQEQDGSGIPDRTSHQTPQPLHTKGGEGAFLLLQKQGGKGRCHRRGVVLLPTYNPGTISRNGVLINQSASLNSREKANGRMSLTKDKSISESSGIVIGSHPRSLSGSCTSRITDANTSSCMKMRSPIMRLATTILMAARKVRGREGWAAISRRGRFLTCKKREGWAALSERGTFLAYDGNTKSLAEYADIVRTLLEVDATCKW